MKKAFILLLVVTLFSCNKKEIPDYVIPVDDMVDIIVEIHITDGLLSVAKIKRDLVQMDTTNFYDVILNSYNYQRQDFDTSLYYYSKNINQYDLMYDEVLNRLSKIDAELKENRSLQDKKRD